MPENQKLLTELQLLEGVTGACHLSDEGVSICDAP